MKDKTLADLSTLVANRLHKLNEKLGNGDQHYVIFDVYGCMHILKESDGPLIVSSYKGEVVVNKATAELCEEIAEFERKLRIPGVTIQDNRSK